MELGTNSNGGYGCIHDWIGAVSETIIGSFFFLKLSKCKFLEVRFKVSLQKYGCYAY